MANYTQHTHGYQKVGTLKQDAYLVAKTFLATYDIDALRKLVKKECSTDPAVRWGWFFEKMLADFDTLLENEIDCESCWLEPEEYDDEEVMDLVPVYVKELCDADMYRMYHPEILIMFHDKLEENIVYAAVEGHYDYLLADDEGINLQLTNPTFWHIASNGTTQELYDYVVKKSVEYVKSFNFASGFTNPENWHANFIWEWDFINRISTEILEGLDEVDGERLRITINKWYNA